MSKSKRAEFSGRSSHRVKIGCEVAIITRYYFWNQAIDHDQVLIMHALVPAAMFSYIDRSHPQICLRNFFFPLLICLANRSYYRCTNPRCNAKKQVERSTEDPDMLIITYEGLHLHYAYSHFFLPRRQGNSPTTLHATKKPKVQKVENLEDPEVVSSTKPEAPTTQQQQQQKQQQQHVIGDEKSPQGRLLGDAPPSPVLREEKLPTEDKARCPQGLLEDIVPLLVWKPCNSTSSQPSYPHYSPSQYRPPNSAN